MTSGERGRISGKRGARSITRELDAGNGEEAERLAVDAVTRFALSPFAWRDLSSVQRFLGNDEEALRAIRRAVELDPEWSTAWLQLGRLLEETGRPAEAIDALRAGVKRNPLAVDVRLKLAGLCWRADQREEAWALAAAAAETDPAVSEVWERLRGWATTLRREEALVELARKITRDRPGEARSWLILATVLPTSAIDEEFAACNAAIFRNPRMGEAYEMKSAALARLGKLDAAEAVIREGPWGEEIPGPLKGRLAWLRALRGDVAGAMAEMSLLLDQQRDYVWGWERLCEWAERRKDLPTWERAAQALMRLLPRRQLGYCHAAAVELHKENTAGAAALLTRALEFEPGHGYAARKLLEYHWNRGDAAALETLPSLLLDGGETGWVSATARILAAALRGDESQLRQHLERLVCAPDDVHALAAFVEHQLTRELPQFRALLESVLDDCVRADRIGPSFATLWVGAQVREDHWECWERFGAWSQWMGEPAGEAIARFLDLAGASPAGAGTLPRLIQAQGPLLRADAVLWGKVGWALTNTGRHRESVDWLAGGLDRPDAMGWMLANQMLSLKALGLSAEASGISAAVLRRGLRDQTWSIHVSQAAFGAARGGDLPAARAILALPLPAPPKGEWAVLRGLGESLVRVLSTPPPGARVVVREELVGLKKLTATHPSPTSALVAEYASAITQMGHHVGSWIPPWKTHYPTRRAKASSGLRTGDDLWRWFWPVIIMALLGFVQQCERTFR